MDRHNQPLPEAPCPVERERRAVAFVQYSFLTILLLAIAVGLGGPILYSGAIAPPRIPDWAWAGLSIGLTLGGVALFGVMYRGQWLIATGSLASDAFEDEYRPQLKSVTQVQIVLLCITTLLGIFETLRNPGGANPTTVTPVFTTLAVVNWGFQGLRLIADLFALLPLFTTIRRVASQRGHTVLAKRAGRNRFAIPLWGTVGILALGFGPLVAMILYYNTLSSYRTMLGAMRDERAAEPTS